MCSNTKPYQTKLLYREIEREKRISSDECEREISGAERERIVFEEGNIKRTAERAEFWGEIITRRPPCVAHRRVHIANQLVVFPEPIKETHRETCSSQTIARTAQTEWNTSPKAPHHTRRSFAHTHIHSLMPCILCTLSMYKVRCGGSIADVPNQQQNDLHLIVDGFGAQ